ncbi:MAG: TlpA family protein disulfide reductase [Solirubrobacteraceae bacterium]
MSTGYGRYIALLGVLLVVVFTLHTAFGSHKGASGLRAGQRIPPFAAPLAIGGPAGEVNVATHRDEGQAGKRPACQVRGVGILNICQLYEHRPVVLALFFDAGSCAGVLDDLQRLAPSYPRVEFAAVAVKEDPGSVARIVRSKRLTIPVGVDPDGRLGGLYTMVSCPQITFVSPGGVLQSAPLLGRAPLQKLRTRVQQLLASSQATAPQVP